VRPVRVKAYLDQDAPERLSDLGCCPALELALGKGHQPLVQVSDAI